MGTPAGTLLTPGGRPQLESAEAPHLAGPAPSALGGKTEPRGSWSGPGSERGPASAPSRSCPFARPRAGKPRSGTGSLLLASAGSEMKATGDQPGAPEPKAAASS